LDNLPPTATTKYSDIISSVGRGFYQHHFLYWRYKMSNNKTPMTSDAAARIQSATAKQNGGSVPKGSVASRASSAAAKNSGSGKQGSK
jgi:hypothetical protein